MKEERIRRSMQMIFDRAIVKVVDRCDKEGNTEQPWDDFTIKHLENRMREEFEEYWDNPVIDELVDIINLATFVALARLNKASDTLSYEDYCKVFA